MIGAACKEVVILRPDGSEYMDTRPMASLNVSVVVEENGRRSQATAAAADDLS